MSSYIKLIHHKLYWKIAQESLEDALRSERTLIRYRESPDPWNPIDCLDSPFYEYMDSVIKSVIFSGLAVESFINYYGITRTSSTQFKKYLDKLEVGSKWIIIPKFVTGNSIDTGSQAIELLGKLIKSRNELVHYKTGESGLGDYYNSTMQGSDSNGRLPWIESAEAGIQAFKELLIELKKIDPNLQEIEYALNEGEHDIYLLWSTDY